MKNKITKDWYKTTEVYVSYVDRGANVSAKLMSMHYRRSPLVQGGIEIPSVVTVPIPGTVINQLLMERYKQLVETLHRTKERGNFGDIPAARKYWWTRSGFGGTKAEKEAEVSSREW